MYIYFSKKRNIKIRVPAERERVQRVLLCIIAFLSVAAIVLGVICSVLYFSVRRLTVEAGAIKSAAELVGDAGAVFEDGFDYTCLNRPGVYYFDVIVGEKTISVRLQVEDRSAPVIKVKNVNCAVSGSLPVPEDFIDTILESGKYSGEFVTPLPQIKAMGTYDVKVRFTDAWGNKTEVFDVSFTVISDSEPPKVELVSEITVTVGEQIDYGKYISLTDNCIGELTYTVDDSGVDINKVGKYKAYVDTEDAIGNTGRCEITVNVVEKTVESDSETET